MRKSLLSFLLLTTASLIPLGCGYFGFPSGPYGGGGYGPGGGSNPVPNPTYAVPAPRFKSSWGTAGGPNALAFGAGTTVYVAEADNSVAMVEVFDSSNPTAPLAQWTHFGSVGLPWPSGVAVNPVNGNVYVADNLNNAVYEFTSAGATVASWPGYGAASFNAPEGIGFDAATTTLYVADTGNDEVEQFDANGNPLYRWGAGSGMAFYQPSAVSTDASGNVYVADAGNERVLKFGPGGVTFLSSWSAVNYADLFGIAVDGSGNVYAADYGDGTPSNGNSLMEEYNPAGYLISVWGSSAGSNIFGPDGVALSGSDVYVADYNNNLIQVFGP